MTSGRKSDVMAADLEVDGYEMASPTKGKFEGTDQDKEDMNVLGRKQVLNVSNRIELTRCL